MSLNLPTIAPVVAPEDAALPPRPRYGSVPMTHTAGPEEVAKLQELLSQALKREAEAHKKMKHLYEHLKNTLQLHGHGRNSVSDASQVGGSDTSWSSDLSQTSQDLSPSSPPPPVVVVQASPRLGKKHAYTAEVHPEHSSPLVLDAVPVHNKAELNSCHHNRLDTRQDSIDKTEGHLSAPSGSDYRGVRQEMERPPTSVSPVLVVNGTEGSAHNHVDSPYQGAPSQQMNMTSMSANASPASGKRLVQAFNLSFELSTSQTPVKTTNRWTLETSTTMGGFGTVCDNGYGISYIVVGEDTVNLSIHSKRSCPDTSSQKMADTIYQTFEDMRALFLN